MVVCESGPDKGLAWHYGDPFGEQRALAAGKGIISLANREVFEVRGPDRLTWLHSLTSQKFEGLAPGRLIDALILSPRGHIEHAMRGRDDGEAFIAWTEPGRRADLLDWLQTMRFMMRVDVALRPDLSVWFNTEESVGDVPDGLTPVGTWAFEALRIEAHVPRLFLDTDFKTIPNEIGLFGTHPNKGCYRGQETVARVQNLGRPPRRLVGLHLDGSMDALPENGAALTLDGREVGFIGSSARHRELGPIGLGLVKRNTPVDATLVADAIPCAQETIVDPNVGLHFRPNL